MWHHWRVVRTVALACAVLLSAGPAWSQPRDAGRVLILDVTVNGQRLNGVQEVGHSDDGRWSLSSALWAELRLLAPRVRVSGGTLDGHAWLDQIEGVQVVFDPERQSLTIMAPANAFAIYRLASDDQMALARGASGTGAYANYELQAGHAHGHTAWTGGLELVGFAPGTRLTGSAYYRNQERGSGRWVRLDTGVEFSDAPKMRSLRLGDQITSAGLWGRPARIGGIGIGTRFAMQPDFVPFALPTLRGEAVLPSTIDVLVNQNLVTSGQVPAGPFEWNQLPTLTGRGDLRLSVTDLLGRKTEIVQPYLVSDQLLRPGLVDFALEAGRIREDYGHHSGRYGRDVLLGQYRRGIAEQLTAELRLETLPDQRTAGAGLVWKIGDWGLMQATAAASGREGRDGHAGSVGLDVPGRAASLQIRSSRSSRFFAQLGADNPDAARQATDRVGVLMPWSHGGIGLTWVERRYWNADPQRFWILSASASFGTRLFLSAYLQSAHFEHRQRTVGINLVVPLESHTQAWAQASRSSGQTTGGLGWMSSLPPGPGWAHRLYAETDGRLSARLERRGASADWRADVDVRDGNVSVGTAVGGSLVLLGGQLRLARRIEGSFALVQVGNLPDVPVYRDQHEVGRTGADGAIILNDLRPYQTNRIHVDPNDLPVDAVFERLQLKLSPALGAGVYADMGVRRVQPWTLRMLGPDGQVVPPGTVLQVLGQASERTVGYDGKLFEPDGAAHPVYTGSVAGRPCRFRAVVAPAPGEPGVPVPVHCEETSP
ncbi:MAG: fimbrial biogenesis outer membrane usher protein [Hydrogenophaga sp.]|uniref:fimbria/pilus outer membrane usher protein n=1 Tax=Hydrogenophaga sp. TaxID=1904254 RepID=UPI0025BCE7F7|nr:fimbria/pilus outer membrane usher protein [Hydrogenophaga sp.]MBT9554249.1 fimbrial biogenesis outer membrane usher protein [Hydrogenophaga sp.]